MSDFILFLRKPAESDERHHVDQGALASMQRILEPHGAKLNFAIFEAGNSGFLIRSIDGRMLEPKKASSLIDQIWIAHPDFVDGVAAMPMPKKSPSMEIN